MNNTNKLPTKLEENFKECEICIKNPGSPQLCNLCLINRENRSKINQVLDYLASIHEEKENINNYTEDNESIKNSDKSILSPQQEDWQKVFLDAGTYETGTDLSCMIGAVSKILQTEIRKAEEIGYKKGWLVLRDEEYYQERIKSIYNKAITDAVGALKSNKRECGNHGLDKINGTPLECYGYDETVNEALDLARVSLEALKK